MDVGGGYILTDDQVAAWIARDEGAEYNEYVAAGLYDPDTHQLFEAPDWMVDGDPTNGPFDFMLTVSQETIGW